LYVSQNKFIDKPDLILVCLISGLLLAYLCLISGLSSN